LLLTGAPTGRRAHNHSFSRRRVKIRVLHFILAVTLFAQKFLRVTLLIAVYFFLVLVEYEYPATNRATMFVDFSARWSVLALQRPPPSQYSAFPALVGYHSSIHSF
jgi:hypothetical protein